MRAAPITPEIERCLRRVRKATVIANTALEHKSNAIKEAASYGATLREIGEAAGTSASSIHRLLRPELRLKG